MDTSPSSAPLSSPEPLAVDNTDAVATTAPPERTSAPPRRRKKKPKRSNATTPPLSATAVATEETISRAALSATTTPSIGLRVLPPEVQQRVELEQEKVLEQSQQQKAKTRAKYTLQDVVAAAAAAPVLDDRQRRKLLSSGQSNSATTALSSSCGSDEEENERRRGGLLAPPTLSPSSSLQSVPAPPLLRRFCSTPGAFHAAPPTSFSQNPSSNGTTAPTPPRLRPYTSSASQSAISSLSSGTTILTATLVESNETTDLPTNDAAMTEEIAACDRYYRHLATAPASLSTHTTSLLVSSPSALSSDATPSLPPLAHAQPLIMVPPKRHSRYWVLLWLVILVSAVALAVGLTLALVTYGNEQQHVSNDINTNNNNSSNQSILTNGPAVPHGNLLSSLQVRTRVAQQSQQTFFAIVWGTDSNCPVLDVSAQRLELSCGANSDNTDPEESSTILAIWRQSAAVVCEQREYHRVSCYQINHNNTTTPDSTADLRIVFSCATNRPADGTPTAALSASVASDCQALLRTVAGVNYYGGTLASYAGIGRFCNASISTNRQDALQLNWQSQCPVSYVWGLQGYEPTSNSSSASTIVHNNAHGITDSASSSSSSPPKQLLQDEYAEDYICFLSSWCDLGSCTPQPENNACSSVSTCNQLLGPVSAIYPASTDCFVAVATTTTTNSSNNNNDSSAEVIVDETLIDDMWTLLASDVPLHETLIHDMFDVTTNYDATLMELYSLQANYVVLWGSATTCLDTISNVTDEIYNATTGSADDSLTDIRIQCGGGTDDAVVVAVDTKFATCDREEDNSLVCRADTGQQGSALITCGADTNNDLLLCVDRLKTKPSNCSRLLSNTTTISTKNNNIDSFSLNYGGASTSYVSTGIFCRSNNVWALQAHTSCLSGTSFSDQNQDFCYVTATCKSSMHCVAKNACSGNSSCSEKVPSFEVVSPNTTATVCTISSSENVDTVKDAWWQLVESQLNGGQAFASVTLAKVLQQLIYEGPTIAPTTAPTLRTPDQVFFLTSGPSYSRPRTNASGQ